ncbi:MAG TPA: nucleoside triphosphate pyrophosphohydrolase [Verrucomicrobiales bacterium]|nr:nucleoside triphosphate pyrophosphohydrolase [Verrucomicrobiales bacterium]
MLGKTPPADSDALLRLRKVVHDLRSPGGCPWDQEQTHQSLLPNLIEEAYEVLEAIQNRDADHMCEELGDLLLQVVLHAEIASETGEFDLDRIAHGISEKLIRRHPHVYGDSSVGDSAGVIAQWEEIKKAEKGDVPKGLLDGVSNALPALSRAAKLQKKAAKVGFDWPDAAGVMEKIREETAEVADAMAAGDADAISEEVGDLLFSVANLARKLNLEPEVLLASANDKFVRRFREMERRLLAQGKEPGSASLDEMEQEWQDAKGRGG